MSKAKALHKPVTGAAEGPVASPFLSIRPFAEAKPKVESGEQKDLLREYVQRRTSIASSILGAGGQIVQRYPPEMLAEDTWVDYETGQQYGTEEDALEGYINWAEENGKNPEAGAVDRLAEIRKLDQEKKKLLLAEIEQQEPPIYHQMVFDGKTVLLVGTTHGDSGDDLSGQVPDDILANAAVILEYPPLSEMQHPSFTEKDIKAVNDKTQAALANRGKNQKGTVLVGADGRKRFIGADQIQGVSLRHKTEDQYTVTEKLIEAKYMHELGEKYVNGALELSKSTIGEVFLGLMDLVEYKGSELSVLIMSSGHLRALSEELERDEREAVKAEVMKELVTGLKAAQGDYEANKNTMLGVERQLIQRHNEEMLGAFFDAVCNLMLFTEVLVNKKPKIVVAFGNEHVKPLKSLLEQVQALREKKKNN